MLGKPIPKTPFEPELPSRSVPVQWPSLSPCERTYTTLSSRPGRPCLPNPEPWPYVKRSEKLIKLGERAVKAATGVVQEELCGGWYMFGDMTWCLKALQTKWGTEQEDGGVIGLSYGIEQRDLWSEKMSNLYRVPTRLYDCFQRPDDSPTLGGKAPNATGKCAEDGDHCYETPYQVFQICSGPETDSIQGRRYESLESHLQDRKRLSVHLKIDTEGSEWEVLAWLLSSPEDMNKIRTLDMEVHLGWVADSARRSSARASMSSTARLDYDIRLLEDLGKFFRCTGSSMEVLAEGWGNDGRGAKCGGVCQEPAAYAAGGFPVSQFAISFVHPDLVL